MYEKIILVDNDNSHMVYELKNKRFCSVLIFARNFNKKWTIMGTFSEDVGMIKKGELKMENFFTNLNDEDGEEKEEEKEEDDEKE